jgi:hypothetical protein
MSSLRYEFQIPDPAKPLRGDVPPCGPNCELVDFKPATPTPQMVVGRTVDEVCTCVGTYGMGGPGFFGLRLGDEWLVVAIWGAASWIEADGRIVEDDFWDTNGMPRPWITAQGDELTGRLVGQPVTSFRLDKRSLAVGVGGMTLSVAESPVGRPILEGNKQPRAFDEDDDLRRAVFLSPTAEVWVR